MEKGPSKAQGLSHKPQPSITVALNWGHKALAQLVTDTFFPIGLLVPVYECMCVPSEFQIFYHKDVQCHGALGNKEINFDEKI